MIGVVLLQKSEGGGLGIGGGGGGGFSVEPGHVQRAHPGHRDPGRDLLITSLVLSMLAGMDRKPRSIIQGGPAQQQTPGRRWGRVAAYWIRYDNRSSRPRAIGPQVPRSQ